MLSGILVGTYFFVQVACEGFPDPDLNLLNSPHTHGRGAAIANEREGSVLPEQLTVLPSNISALMLMLASIRLLTETSDRDSRPDLVRVSLIFSNMLANICLTLDEYLEVTGYTGSGSVVAQQLIVDSGPRSRFI